MIETPSMFALWVVGVLLVYDTLSELRQYWREKRDEKRTLHNNK